MKAALYLILIHIFILIVWDKTPVETLYMAVLAVFGITWLANYLEDYKDALNQEKQDK